MRRVSRSQVTHVPISNCSCSMCAMTVSKLMSTCGKKTAARRAGVRVDWGLSQRPAGVGCGLSYTTGQATIARSAIVACVSKKQIVVCPSINRQSNLQLSYLLSHRLLSLVTQSLSIQKKLQRRCHMRQIKIIKNI